MAFKSAPPAEIVAGSPEELLLSLPRRKIPGVLLHQGEMMRTYAATATNSADVALQLPTGSGKTLVGLMIAEWRRRKFRERVVYLCPTRQLVNQVVEQAQDQYGLIVLGFTGSKSEYAPSAKAQYQNSDHIAITTYSSLFNTNPFFSTPDVIIVDDAHARRITSRKLGRFALTGVARSTAPCFKPFLLSSRHTLINSISPA